MCPLAWAARTRALSSSTFLCHSNAVTPAGTEGVSDLHGRHRGLSEAETPASRAWEGSWARTPGGPGGQAQLRSVPGGWLALLRQPTHPQPFPSRVSAKPAAEAQGRGCWASSPH